MIDWLLYRVVSENILVFVIEIRGTADRRQDCGGGGKKMGEGVVTIPTDSDLNPSDTSTPQWKITAKALLLL